LTQSHLLHMTKDACLKDLPPQTRIFKEVPVSSQSQLRHTAALHDLAKIYYSTKATKNDQAVLGAVQILRQVDSLAKVDATVALAMSILETEPAVVIFTSFVEVAKRVHAKLESAGWNGEVLTGETPAAKRQAMVDSFQSGLSSVFVGTYGAGGVGLTLTAASTVVLLDRPWTPGDVHQAEDRVRRIGQTKPVTSIWMTAFDLDKQIDSMLASKSQTASSVLCTSNTTTAANDAGAKLSIFRLLQTVLPPPK
jgi:SNF2 family DNA or RNA helicase